MKHEIKELAKAVGRVNYLTGISKIVCYVSIAVLGLLALTVLLSLAFIYPTAGHLIGFVIFLFFIGMLQDQIESVKNAANRFEWWLTRILLILVLLVTLAVGKSVGVNLYNIAEDNITKIKTEQLWRPESARKVK